MRSRLDHCDVQHNTSDDRPVFSYIIYDCLVITAYNAYCLVKIYAYVVLFLYCYCIVYFYRSVVHKSYL